MRTEHEVATTTDGARFFTLTRLYRKARREDRPLYGARHPRPGFSGSQRAVGAGLCRWAVNIVFLAIAFFGDLLWFPFQAFGRIRRRGR